MRGGGCKGLILSETVEECSVPGLCICIVKVAWMRGQVKCKSAE